MFSRKAEARSGMRGAPKARSQGTAGPYECQAEDVRAEGTLLSRPDLRAADPYERKPGTETSETISGRRVVSITVTKNRSRNQKRGGACPVLALSRRWASAVSASQEATSMHLSTAAAPQRSA